MIIPHNIDTLARSFLETYFIHRNINRQFYQLVPASKFDHRMVDNRIKKSDSVRESLAHQIAVQKTYLQAFDTGKLQFGTCHTRSLLHLSKLKLLSTLDSTDRHMIKLLTDSSVITKKIHVPWADQPICTIDMLWSLNSHEILHTGWNLAVMDHLGIERFPALRDIWG